MVTVVDLFPPMARCCICGKWDLSRWGVPVSMETASIVANDFDGDWGGKPACEDCWKKHDVGGLVGVCPKF